MRLGAATLCAFALLAPLWAAPAVAQEVVSVRVSQAHARLPEVVAYLDAVDGDNQPATTLDKVEATLRNQSLALQKLVPFENSGEGVAYLFLVDISASLRPPQFERIKSALERWISGLDGADRAAILSFGDTVSTVADFTNDQEVLRAALEGLAPRDRNTQFHLALRRALEVGQRQDPDLPTRRVIVVLTDGKDEGSGLTEEDVVGLLKEDPVPIYAIGYSRLSNAERQRYLDVLKRFVELSGGIFFQGTEESLDEVYERTRQAIRRVWTARFQCAACEADGQIHQLVVTTTTSGDRRFPARYDVRALAGAAPAVQPEEAATNPSTQSRRPWGIFAAVALLGLALLVAALWFWRRGNQEPEDVYEPEAVPEPEMPSSSLPAPAATPSPVPPVAEEEAPPPPAAPAPVDPSSRTLQLLVVHGRTSGHSYEVVLHNRCVVGTASGTDLQINEEGVEPHHFEFSLDNHKVWIRDLTQARKTSVNGVPIAGAFQLEQGDLILAGRTELRIGF